MCTQQSPSQPLFGLVTQILEKAKCTSVFNADSVIFNRSGIACYGRVKCYLSTLLPIAEVTGSNPVAFFFEALNFFQASLFQFHIHPQFIYESFHMHYIFPQIELFAGCAPTTGKKSPLAETVSKQF